MKTTLENKIVIESSSLFLDLSNSLLNKIDSFITENELSDRERKRLLKLMEEIHSEGVTNGLII